MEVNCEPGSSNLMSPVKKHVQGKGLTSGEKIQIVNGYKTLLNDNPGITVRDMGCKVCCIIILYLCSEYVFQPVKKCIL